MLGQHFISQLTADPYTENRPRKVTGAHFSLVKPQLFDAGKIIHFNDELAKELSLIDADRGPLVDIFLGRKEVASFAMRYGGHQFGHWAGQLGDGRAINVGDIRSIKGKNIELQIKGAGPTPYSRTADGYAVLRSSIREYLCSEAMHHLGIPTTRALAYLQTGEPVLRDMMYNGNAAYEPGAIVCRTAESFVRFGNFEILASHGEHDLLRQLLDYCIESYHPDLKDDDDKYCAFFDRVSNATCDMVVEWMRVGFVHGVMNTDNMSILGDTIDYGPYGWIDNFDPNWTPNTTDLPGRRYAFGRQPQIAQWNIIKLANAIATILPDESIEKLKISINKFAERYEAGFLQMMKAKLGLMEDHYDDKDLAIALEVALYKGEFDMTLFYRNLAKLTSIDQIETLFSTTHYGIEIGQEIRNWLERYLERLTMETVSSEERKAAMDRVNPKYILRNYMTQMAIDEAHKGNYSIFEQLFSLIKKPYEEQPEMHQWFALRPAWAVNKVGCSMLSCSS